MKGFSKVTEGPSRPVGRLWPPGLLRVLAERKPTRPPICMGSSLKRISGLRIDLNYKDYNRIYEISGLGFGSAPTAEEI